MKAIMLSIQPQWVEKILNGEKTIEIRKTKPSCELPIKVYIYQTKNKDRLIEVVKKGDILYDTEIYTENKPLFVKTFDKYHFDKGNGKVVAGFTLKEVDKIECDSEQHKKYCKGSCLSQDDFIQYCNGQDLYAWHISDLKIYDEPKELSEFELPIRKECKTCFLYPNICENACEKVKLHLFRPPQSWCYVEELEENNNDR